MRASNHEVAPASSFTRLLKKKFIPGLAAFFCLIALASGAPATTGDPGADLGPLTETILDNYVHAAANQNGVLPGTSMEVEIEASIPKLKENGRLRALRVISKVGHISYHVLGFQGSNTVKSQVIARYLQAEQQGQSDPRLALTPVNYRFKLKGERITEAGLRTYVFTVVPRHAAPGLFKGELWLDANSYLPVYEKGRLSKNPSIFFKKVDFERAFAIQNGRVVPQHISSVITTRVVGRVELNVNYSKYEQAAVESEDFATGATRVSAP